MTPDKIKKLNNRTTKKYLSEIGVSSRPSLEENRLVLLTSICELYNSSGKVLWQDLSNLPLKSLVIVYSEGVNHGTLKVSELLEIYEQFKQQVCEPSSPKG